MRGDSPEKDVKMPTNDRLLDSLIESLKEPRRAAGNLDTGSCEIYSLVELLEALGFQIAIAPK